MVKDFIRAVGQGYSRRMRGREAVTLAEFDLEAEYREAALDKEREQEAHEWCEAQIADGLPEDDFSRPATGGRSTSTQ
jgi:hypothetical protein